MTTPDRLRQSSLPYWRTARGLVRRFADGRAWLVALALSGGVTFTRPVAAAESSVPETWAERQGRRANEAKRERRDRAQELYRKGLIARKERALERAYWFFHQAWQLDPNFDTAASLGFAEAELKKHASAASHLQLALEQLPITQRARYEEELKRKLAEEKSRVAELKLVVEQEGVVVVIDGKPQSSPIRFLAPGTHEILFRGSGFRERRVQLKLVAGESRRLIALLEPDRQGAPYEQEPERQPMVLLLGGGVTAALGVGALTFGWLASKKLDEARALGDGVNPSLCSTRPSSQANQALCQRIKQQTDSAEDGAATATGLGVATVLAAVATVATYSLWRKLPVEASVTASSAQIRLRGVF